MGLAGTSARRGDSFLFGAKEAKTYVGSQSSPPKVSILVQQDQDHVLRRADVIAEPTSALPLATLQAKTTFRQDKVYSLSPTNLAVVGSLPSNAIREEEPGHYK